MAVEQAGGRPGDGGSGPRVAVVLLACASGAVDALSFTALGHVFAGVMTGNLALLGMAVGRVGTAGVTSALLAFAGFGGGLVSAALLCRGHDPEGPHWPRRIIRCLVGEAALLACWAGAWAACAGRPDEVAQRALLCGAAAAMGAQSGAMAAAGPTGSPSTYLTGTLTTFVHRGLANTPGARPGPGRWDRWVPVRLTALPAGAAAAVALHIAVPAWAGVLPAALVAAAVLAGSQTAPAPRNSSISSGR